MNRIFTAVFAITICWCAVADAQFRSRYSRSGASSKEDDKKSEAQSRYDRYKKSSGKSEGKSGDSKNYRFLSPHERLPEGVPTWFIEKDTDFDGQVKMAEFSSKWSESIVAEYAKYDKNFDGFITPDECLAAKQEGIVYNGSGGSSSRIASKSGSSSSPFGGSRYSSKTSTEPPKPKAVATKPEEKPQTEPAKTSPAEATATAEDDGLPAPSKAYLSYALKVIAKYDKNGDNTLEKKEWEAMSKNPASADTSGDGRISPTEYARFLMPKK